MILDKRTDLAAHRIAVPGPGIYHVRFDQQSRDACGFESATRKKSSGGRRARSQWNYSVAFFLIIRLMDSKVLLIALTDLLTQACTRLSAAHYADEYFAFSSIFAINDGQ
jgi:hypothetical protein